MVEALENGNANMIYYVPPKAITKGLFMHILHSIDATTAMKWMIDCGSDSNLNLTREVFDQVIEHALETDYYALQYLPPEYLTQHRCLIAVSNHYEAWRLIKFTPDLMRYKMLMVAMTISVVAAHNNLRGFGDIRDLPAECRRAVQEVGIAFAPYQNRSWAVPGMDMKQIAKKDDIAYSGADFLSIEAAAKQAGTLPYKELKQMWQIACDPEACEVQKDQVMAKYNLPPTLLDMQKWDKTIHF
jgi:hypothetical protein